MKKHGHNIKQRSETKVRNKCVYMTKQKGVVGSKSLGEINYVSIVY
jgi:hypothetical protein